MSERSCNKCLFGQGEIDHYCKGCILKNNFVKSDIGVQIVHPPIKDDQAKEVEDLVGFCPKCGDSLEYNRDHQEDEGRITYLCLCFNEDCNWSGKEVHNISFPGLCQHIDLSI